MIEALKQAIATDVSSNGDRLLVDVLSPDAALKQPVLNESIICPLTLNLPDGLPFASNQLYQACRDVDGLRQQVQQLFNVSAGTGQFWLPIVLTAKGPLYGEVIGAEENLENPGVQGAQDDWDTLTYYQPLHLPDRLRQSLYRLGGQLLRSLQASPATYLLQVGLEGDRIWFDRLFPFPAAPAIASIGTQSPNLFTCHWRCLTQQPIQDLVILPKTYRLHEIA
jgi:hypothetical protein